MQIYCPTCGAPVGVEQMNVQALVATCGPCNAVFSFADQVPREPKAPTRPSIPRPDSIQVSGQGNVLTLTRRWFNFGAIFLTFFCLFWDGFLVVWYGAALMSPQFNLIMVLFPLGHVAVGVFLTYTTLALYLNSTVLTMTRHDVSIKHGPLKWPGNQTVPLGDVDQFYSEEIRGSKGSRSYNLSALLKNGAKIRLLTGLTDGQSALFFEQQLEQWFGITDRPVEGELQR